MFYGTASLIGVGLCKPYRASKSLFAGKRGVNNMLDTDFLKEFATDSQSPAGCDVKYIDDRTNTPRIFFEIHIQYLTNQTSYAKKERMQHVNKIGALVSIAPLDHVKRHRK